VNTDPDGETTFYSYLKQSDLKESGYTRGLETGSLNYFKGKATIDDAQTYYDGRIDAKHPANLTWNYPDYLHNSTVNHRLTVDYRGKKGLSLFYAKGFYRSNRAVTASKKIWFGNATYYPTRSINLDGNAEMDMGGKYLMDYNIIKATDAYFVFNDASGLSNKTGSRRIDWEQEGLIKGDISDTQNYLLVNDEFIARAGIRDDWLPCFCFTGLVHPIEPIYGNDSAWPSEEIKDALRRPAPPENATVEKCGNGTMEGSCGSEYCEQVTEQSKIGAGTRTGFLDYPDVWVEAFIKEDSENSGWHIYDITVNIRNSGTTNVEQVSLVAERIPNDPTKVTYVEGSGRIDDVIAIPTTIEENYLWGLGPMTSVLTGREAKRTVSFKINSSESMSGSMQFHAQYMIGSRQITTDPVKPTGEERFGGPGDSNV
jgi:hypothetical protein